MPTWAPEWQHIPKSWETTIIGRSLMSGSSPTLEELRAELEKRESLIAQLRSQLSGLGGDSQPHMIDVGDSEGSGVRVPEQPLEEASASREPEQPPTVPSVTREPEQPPT
eukprot:864718-Pyramimonas_sp.AAC.1